MSRKLLRGELVVARWMNLTLTTHRVWQYRQDAGGVELTTFGLEDIEWARVGRSLSPWLLWTAAGTAVAAVVLFESSPWLVYSMVAMSVLLAVLYITQRQLEVRIGAKGREIVAAAAEDASEESALEFIHMLESHKHARGDTGIARPEAANTAA